MIYGYGFLAFRSAFLQMLIVSILYGVLINAAAADVWDKWEGFADENRDNEGVEDFIWAEDGSNLPDFPQEKDLLEVDGPPAYSSYQYLIDETSLTIGKDRVIRFSLLIRSKSGADNVFYDGIRCSTRQIKNYAYGVTDKEGKKTFAVKNNTQWRAFRSNGITAYGAIFAAGYFCDQNALNLKKHEVIQNIKYGKGNVDGLYY